MDISSRIHVVIVHILKKQKMEKLIAQELADQKMKMMKLAITANKSNKRWVKNMAYDCRSCEDCSHFYEEDGITYCEITEEPTLPEESVCICFE